MRSAAAAEAGRLVDLGGRLGPEGGSRLAALLLVAPPPQLAELNLRWRVGLLPRLRPEASRIPVLERTRACAVNLFFAICCHV